MARRTKAQAQATKEAIIEAALRVFYRRGVTKTSLTHIAKEAGVTRGAIYWHFRDKQDLFETLLDQGQLPLETLTKQIQMDNGKAALQKLQQHLTELLQRVAIDEVYRQFYEVVLLKCEFNHDNQALLLRQQKVLASSKLHIKNILQLAVDAGDLPAQLDLTKAASYLQASAIGVLYSWLLAPAAYDLHAYAPAFVATLIGSLKISAELID